jgi:hypothetical protein
LTISGHLLPGQVQREGKLDGGKARRGAFISQRPKGARFLNGAKMDIAATRGRQWWLAPPLARRLQARHSDDEILISPFRFLYIPKPFFYPIGNRTFLPSRPPTWIHTPQGRLSVTRFTICISLRRPGHSYSGRRLSPFGSHYCTGSAPPRLPPPSKGWPHSLLRPKCGPDTNRESINRSRLVSVAVEGLSNPTDQTNTGLVPLHQALNQSLL